MTKDRLESGLTCLRALLLSAAIVLNSCMLLPSAPTADTTIAPAPMAPPHEVELAPATAPAGESAPAAEPAEPVEPAEPLALTVQEAILAAMEHNRALAVERLNPEIARTFEQEQRAAFDPRLAAEVAGSAERRPATAGLEDRSDESAISAAAAVVQTLPTGTDVSLGPSSERLKSDLRDDQYVNRLGLTVNQALLRGAGLDVNLASVHQARLDTLASQYELRGFAQSLLADTEEAYWDYALAVRTIEIVTNAMALAEQQVRETRERIEVGVLAQTELAAAEAELARRRENLINARGAQAVLRLRLRRLLNLQENGQMWDREIVLRTAPVPPAVVLDDVETYVQVAMRMRPDLNQARLGVQRNDLDLVRTRNGLLPRLDLFVTLGKTGYAESFGESLANVADDGDYDALIGLRLEHDLANRAARSRHQRALYSREQAIRAVDNLAQLVQVDVRAAYIEVQRAGEQVVATAATRRLGEETLRAETEKYRVGKSTSFLVAQAQRDLLQSQIAEVGAVVSHLKSLVRLHLQQGALLERRGILAPGGTPVDLSAAPQW